MVDPRGHGVGQREKTYAIFCKVIPRTENVPESSPSSSIPAKKRIYKANASISSKKNRNNREPTSAPKTPSSIKTRYTIKEGKGKPMELEEEKLEQQPNNKINDNETLYSQEEEVLEKPPKAPTVEMYVGKRK